MRTIINIATVIFMVAMVVTAYMTRYGVIEEWGTVFAVDCIGLTLITVYNVFIDKQSIFYITKLMEEE